MPHKPLPFELQLLKIATVHPNPEKARKPRNTLKTIAAETTTAKHATTAMAAIPVTNAANAILGTDGIHAGRKIPPATEMLPKASSRGSILRTAHRTVLRTVLRTVHKSGVQIEIPAGAAMIVTTGDAAAIPTNARREAHTSMVVNCRRPPPKSSFQARG